jgi:hypothetical protein
MDTFKTVMITLAGLAGLATLWARFAPKTDN